MSDLQRITFVDDEPDIRAIVQIALEEIGGFTVQMCECGSQVIEEAPKFCPDIVLLDVMMPDMDGLATYRALRNRGDMDTVPFVFLTAKAQTHEVEHYRVLGAADVIIKPFNPLTLPDRVRGIWTQSRSEG